MGSCINTLVSSTNNLVGPVLFAFLGFVATRAVGAVLRKEVCALPCDISGAINS